MSRGLSTTAGRQQQAVVRKHSRLRSQGPSALPAAQSGPIALPLTSLSIAQMQKPSAQEPLDAPELECQYQQWPHCTSGTRGACIKIRGPSRVNSPNPFGTAADWTKCYGADCIGGNAPPKLGQPKHAVEAKIIII